MKLLLERRYFPKGTNGALFLNGVFLCCTIELPWKENIPRVSCIPEGNYRVHLRWSERFQQHLLVEDVPGRSLILIHPANDALTELKGCIAPVTRITGVGRGVLSRQALQLLLNQITEPHLLKEEIDLEIRRAVSLPSFSHLNMQS